MRTRRTAVVALLGVTAVAATGCAGPRVVRDGDVTLLVGTARQGGDALISGTLGVSAAGCVGIVFEDGGDVVPAVWPPGTQLALEGRAIEHDGRVIELGEPVHGSGGDDPAAGFEVPEECGSSHYAVLWELQQRS